jgi:hypothetical protein
MTAKEPTKPSKTKKSTTTKAKPTRELDEIKNLEEPIALPVKTRGRPKNADYISYEEAREFVRGEMIPSRKKFHEWYDVNKPKAIPRFPYRVYGEEWVSWNDFLGTNNEFGLRAGKAWRELEEAALWVHSLKIESYADWLKYCKEHTMPEDIPARPDLVYSKWKSWMHWLGNRPIEKLEAVKAAQKLQIFFVIHEEGYPTNVLTFGVDKSGPASFKARWEREKFDIVKMYWYDQSEGSTIKNIVDQLSSPYLGEEHTRIVPNFWEINWHLSMKLELFRP